MSEQAKKQAELALIQMREEHVVLGALVSTLEAYLAIRDRERLEAWSKGTRGW